MNNNGLNYYLLVYKGLSDEVSLYSKKTNNCENTRIDRIGFDKSDSVTINEGEAKEQPLVFCYIIFEIAIFIGGAFSTESGKVHLQLMHQNYFIIEDRINNSVFYRN